MSDHNSQNDDKGNAVLLLDDRNGLKELEIGGNLAVGPAGNQERRGDRINALTSDMGNLTDGSKIAVGHSLRQHAPCQGWEGPGSGWCGCSRWPILS